MIKNKKNMFITTAVCLLPIIMGLMIYNQLPAEIITHYDANGVADKVTAKEFAVFGRPAILAVVNIIYHISLEKDLRNLHTKKLLMTIAGWALPVLSVLSSLLMYLIALGY